MGGRGQLDRAGVALARLFGHAPCDHRIEILRQLATGATTDEIAANLNLSTKTVQNYHYLIRSKTGLKTDALLVRLALEAGLAGTCRAPAGCT